LLEGLKSVAQSAQMPFLAYLITVALEEANNEKSSGG
jgi:phosphoribosylcarboxyaminoimidazole (NCAIR) mutase